MAPLDEQEPAMPPEGETPDTQTRLQDAEREVAAANARLQAFMYGVSHDLRAPLRAIDGFAGRLAHELGAQASDNAVDALGRIRAATARMATLVDGMVDMARVGGAELRPMRVDVSLLADWCLAELQDAEPQREVDAMIQPGLEVVGDERLLKTMLAQLVGNAWRFSASRDKVVLAVEGERTGDGLHLRISDKGIGFDPAYAAKLFQPFQRLHGVDDGAGHGLGLAIAAQVAARHGGDITGSAVEGQGATFEVRLRDLHTEEKT